MYENTYEELSKVRTEIGAVGGKAETLKKIAHVTSIVSQGSQTVTDKKREHLRNPAASL